MHVKGIVYILYCSKTPSCIACCRFFSLRFQLSKNNLICFFFLFLVCVVLLIFVCCWEKLNFIITTSAIIPPAAKASHKKCYSHENATGFAIHTKDYEALVSRVTSACFLLACAGSLQYTRHSHKSLGQETS